MVEERTRVYFGVGVSTYEWFAKLPAAAPKVRELADHLGTRGYTVVGPITDPSEDEARTALRDHLKQNSLRVGSCLIVLWSGHADLQPEGLRLIARDTSKDGTPELTPEYLASWIARSGATQILLLLDTCYAGAGVVEAQDVIAQIQLERSDTVWFGVLGSALALERAKDGVFVTRLLDLLEHGPKDLVEARRWSVHNEGVRGDDVINALIADWSETEHRPRFSIQGDGPPLVMLPNPSFDADAPAQVVEHLLLAAAGRAPDEEGIYFTGRKTQLEEIVAWANRGHAGVFLLTGPAGSGKSAIAGRIASLSNPRRRDEILGVGPIAHADPGTNSVAANVHLRGLTVDQAAGELDRQLVASGTIPQTAGGAPRGRGDLVAELRRSTRAPLIVLDGLDEAGSEARPIVRDLVSLLAPAARVLVTTRPLRPEVSDETNAAQVTDASQTIDLGAPQFVDGTSRDVKAYVAKRLERIDPERIDPEHIDPEHIDPERVDSGRVDPGRVDPEHIDSEHIGPERVDHEHMDPAKVAEAIDRSTADQGEGAFLLARVVTSQLRAEPIDTSIPGWESALSRSIEEAFEKDLGRSDDPARVRALLTALAWGYGSGVPDDVWQVIANALAPEAIYRRDDVYAVLRAAGRYIVEDGSGGRAVYRLSHQRLVDHLRPRGDAADFDARMERAAAVAVSLVDHYLALLGAGTPAREHDYLRFYTWRHCSDGGAVGIAALRKLVAVDVGVFLPDLAMALSDLGNRFSEFGRRQEALPPVREAVSIYRDLARDNAAFLPDLSMALNNLGGCFSELGRPREALEPTQEAVSLCQDLARDNPVFLSNLEIATNNLTRLEERSASPLSRVLTRLRNALTKLMGG